MKTPKERVHTARESEHRRDEATTSAMNIVRWIKKPSPA